MECGAGGERGLDEERVGACRALIGMLVSWWTSGFQTACLVAVRRVLQRGAGGGVISGSLKLDTILLSELHYDPKRRAAGGGWSGRGF